MKLPAMLIASAALVSPTFAQTPPVPVKAIKAKAAKRVITVDAAVGRHSISPLIYGVAFTSMPRSLKALNSPLNRSGGNAMTRYNWKQNASNHANDWYFESLAEPSAAPGGMVDDFIKDSKAAGAQAMVTDADNWLGR